MNKREMTERQRQEDIALHKVLYWMGGAAVLVLLLRWMQGAYIDHDRTQGAVLLAWNLGRALPWLLVAGVLLTVGGFLFARADRRKGHERVFPWALGGFFLAFTLCVLGVWMYAGVGIQLVTYLVIGLTILSMLYYLYQHDFVAVSMAGGLGLLGLWLFFREGGTVRVYVAVAGILVLLAAIALFARYLQKQGGVLTVKGKKFELLLKTAAYPLIYITCALVAVVLAAALIFSGILTPMVFYAVLVAWLLIMAVYYTVKLM